MLLQQLAQQLDQQRDSKGLGLGSTGTVKVTVTVTTRCIACVRISTDSTPHMQRYTPTVMDHCTFVCLFVQAAPRDALIGDLSPAASRSACFGFAQSMRKWGSFMGAGLAFALMKASDNNYRAIFLLAAGGWWCFHPS